MKSIKLLENEANAKQAEVRAFCDQIGNREFTDEEQAKADELMAEYNGLLAELEQAREGKKRADALRDMNGGFGMPDGVPVGRKAWAESAVKALQAYQGELKTAKLPPVGAVRLQKALTAVPPAVEGQPVPTLLSLIPRGASTGSKRTCDWFQETVRTHAAAAVGETSKKPTSTYTLTAQSSEYVKIAHVSPAFADEWLADFGIFKAFILNTMLEGLLFALEDEILQGTGSGHLLGFCHTSGVGGQTFSNSALETIRKAITGLETLGVTPNGIVISPDDWEAVELSITSVVSTPTMWAPGNPVPVERSARRCWGLPVALSTQ